MLQMNVTQSQSRLSTQGLGLGLGTLHPCGRGGGGR
jgi:hypothetical protein